MLIEAPRVFKLGNHVTECPHLKHRLEIFAGVFRGQYLVELRRYPLNRYSCEQIHLLRNCLESVVVYFKVQSGSEPVCPHNPQSILGKPVRRVSNALYDGVLHVFQSTETVDQSNIWIVGHRVYCEISPFQIFSEVRSEHNTVRSPVVRISSVYPVRGHLYVHVPVDYRHRSVLYARIYRPLSCTSLHLVRLCICGYVPVVWNLSHYAVSYTTSHYICFKSRILKGFYGSPH